MNARWNALIPHFFFILRVIRIDIFARIRHIEFMKIYCTNFAELPCYIRVAPTVAVDLRFTP